MKLVKPQHLARRILIALAIFVGLSALAGGLALVIAPDGHLLGFDAAWMRGVFTSYRVPGAILLGLGVVQLAAAAWLVRRFQWDLYIAAFAGAALVVWIAVQVVLIGPNSAQQAIFAVIGFIMYTLAMELVHGGHGGDDAHHKSA